MDGGRAKTAKRRADEARARAERDHARYETGVLGHWLCPESKGFKRHLVAALGEHAYVYVVPPARRLCADHCYIAPLKPAEALTMADEEVAAEVGRFKLAVRAMCAARGGGVLFLETAASLSGAGGASA